MSRLSLEALLTLSTSQFYSSMNKVDGAVKNFAGGLKSAIAGAFSVGALVMWTKSVVDHVTQIKDMSEQYNISTDAVQRLQLAASKVGLEFDQMGKALFKLRAAREEAVKKGGDKERIFGEWGISIDQLNNKFVTEIDLMDMLATKMEEGATGTKQMSDMDELLGAKISKVAAAMKELKTLGAIPLIPKRDIETIDKMDKALEIFKLKAKAQTASVFSYVLENPKSMLPSMFGILGTKKFIENYQAWLVKKLAEEEGDKSNTGPVPGEDNRIWTEREEKIKVINDALKQQQSITEKLFDVQLKLMDREERKMVMQEEFNALLQDADDLLESGDYKGMADKQNQAAGLVSDMAGIDSAKKYKAHLSSLQQIGAYGGTYMEGVKSESDSKAIARKMLDAALANVAATRKVEEAVKKGGAF